MKTKWVSAALLAAVSFGTSARGAEILIDDFASKPSSFYIIGTPTPPFYPNGQPLKESGLPSTLGGERDTKVEVLGTPTAQSAQFLLGVDPASFPTGVFHVATAGNPASVATLTYDGEESAGLDFSLPESGAFLIDFLSIDSPGSPEGLKVDIHLTSVGGGTATFSDFAPESSIATTFSAPLASFLASPEFDSEHISGITYVFNQAGLADADFTVDNLRAVPEPSTLTLAGAALLGAIFLRRRG